MEDKKVRCIVGYAGALSIDKEYSVTGEDDKRYFVKNDLGNKTGILKEYFEEVKEKEQKQKEEYSFRELITNIKPALEYICQGFKVRCLEDSTIQITTPSERIIGFYANDKFTKVEESKPKENRDYLKTLNLRPFFQNRERNKPTLINYEEEYNKLKKENDIAFQYLDDKSEAQNNMILELDKELKEVYSTNERLANKIEELENIKEHYQAVITEREKENLILADDICKLNKTIESKQANIEELRTNRQDQASEIYKQEQEIKDSNIIIAESNGKELQLRRTIEELKRTVKTLASLL